MGPVEDDPGRSLSKIILLEKRTLSESDSMGPAAVGKRSGSVEEREPGVADGVLLTKDWIALMISCIASTYYAVIQDFFEVNTIVVVVWSILNLALVYRVVASIYRSKK